MKTILLLSLAVLLSFGTAFGQTSSGVTGVVTDSSGAVIPGVKVTLSDTKTSQEQTTVTSDQGTYTFTNIQPGAGFKLTFAATGFQTYVLNEVQVGTARTETQNAQLTAGQVTETVEVVSTGGEATLNTTDGSIGNVIGSRQLRELPIQIRGTPAALIGLQPGAVGSNVFAGATGGNRTGSVTGSRADQGNITVDGIDANDVTTGQAFNTVANAPIDSIQEFRGTVAGMDASAGRSSGGQIQLTTNSGTNQFHGSLREYYRNEEASANSFFNNRNRPIPIDRPKLRRHQYGGSIGGPVPLFNFGENNGPAFRSGKDKLFFFFDNERRRDRSQSANVRTVPLQTFRNGMIGFTRATNATTGATCAIGSRANDPATAGCIEYLSVADLAARDPRGIGVNTALLNLYNSRFPLPNDLTGGDGINTGLFRFNSPNLRDDNIYTLRFDAVPTDRQRVFVRTTITRRNSTNALQFLPQDEDAVTFQDRSYAIAANHTWIITPNLSNVITAGLSKQQNIFAPSNAPTFPFSFSGGLFGSSFAGLSSQDRYVSVPTYRDDVTYNRGSHTFFAGVSFKPIRQKSSLTNDFNFVGLGLGGLTANFDSAPDLRPANLLNNATARARFDTAFATILGRIGTVSTNFNYDAALQPLPAGSGKVRNYAYNEYEAYVQDNWKIKSNLTVNMGVRYTFYPAPYETEGIFSADQTDYRTLFAKRQANAAAGIAGNNAEPFLVYNLAGKANDAPPLYQTDKNNFAPRVGFAYNPSFKDGVMGTIFGDRKTVLRGSFGTTYERVTGAVLFIQNQSDYLFANTASKNFGNANARTALLNDPRFLTVNTVPAAVSTVAPTITRPFTPFVTGGVPTGSQIGATNYTIDQKFKTPYSHLFSFGFQRELPGNNILDISYVGRLGRSLFVQSDVAQVLNFKDAASGQFLFDAFNQLQSRLLACQAAGTSPAVCRSTFPALPFFENQVGPAVSANYGAPCNAFGLGANCTQLAASQISNFLQVGNTADSIQALRSLGFLNPNVGLSGQFATNAYITNQGTSDYHGMLVSFQKRFSRGFEYEVNYTFSKSLDNNSTVANTVFGGLVCDVANPDICRGPSDFDITHLFNANFIAEVPFGRGRTFGTGVNKFVDFFLGGWTLSGIVSARSGLPFSASPSAGSFPLSYVLGSPGIITDITALRNTGVRTSADGTNLQFFADPSAANAALRDPRHGELGSRNQLRGPTFWGIDMGLAKRFNVPWSETHRFRLGVDAFNLTNTPQFGLPNVTRSTSTTGTPGLFGQITTTSNTPRELQFSLRYDF